MSATETILKKIDDLEGKEQGYVAWLLSMLDHPESIIRFAAIRPLIYRCSSPYIIPKLWQMLAIEADEDVILLIISALASNLRGTKDAEALHQFHTALKRVGGGREGTRETYDDAKLSVMLGLDAKQIVRMTIAERGEQVAKVNARLKLN